MREGGTQTRALTRVFIAKNDLPTSTIVVNSSLRLDFRKPWCETAWNGMSALNTLVPKAAPQEFALEVIEPKAFAMEAAVRRLQYSGN